MAIVHDSPSIVYRIHIYFQHIIVIDNNNMKFRRDGSRCHTICCQKFLKKALSGGFAEFSYTVILAV